MDFLLSQNNLYIVLIALVSGVMLLWPSINRRGGKITVGQSEAIQLANHQHAIFVDTRAPEKFKAGTIAQARNIPAAELGAKAGTLPKDKPVIVFCEQGRSSVGAATTLRKQGVSGAVSLESGLQGWIQAGLPTTTRKS